ncbi:LysM peptidoglycan-binding domain-containing protein (plasmid) [Vibrio alginolyticus]
MDLTYTIKQGDCLSLIAEKFGIDDLSVLQDLNSDVIKSVDWIYAGDTLRLPSNEAAPHKLDTGTRVVLPKAPQEVAGAMIYAREAARTLLTFSTFLLIRKRARGSVTR